MAKVSVVIPTFNCGQYICQAIDSALKQTYQDREIIVVDDGSTDGTKGIIAPYIEAGTIKYIYQDNRGLPGARNTGIQNAEGDFIVVLDADDELDERMLALCLEKIEQEGTDWCVCDIVRIEFGQSNPKKEVYRSRIPKGNFVKEILLDDFIRRSPFFRKKSLFEIGLYHEDIQIRVDWEINIRLFLAGKRFSYVPEPIYIYKLRRDSLVKKVHKEKFDYHLKLLKKHHKRLADAGDSEIAKIYAHNLWRLAKSYIVEVGAVKAGISCIFESMKYDFSISRLMHPFYHHLIKPLVRQDKASKRVKAER